MLGFSPRSLCLGGSHRTRRIQRKADRAFRGLKSGREYDIPGLLRGGHTACILVERVEKPTDNRPARPLCYPKWLTLIPRCDRPGVGPGALRRTPPPLGATTKTRPRSPPGATLKDR